MKPKIEIEKRQHVPGVFVITVEVNGKRWHCRCMAERRTFYDIPGGMERGEVWEALDAALEPKMFRMIAEKLEAKNGAKKSPRKKTGGVA